MLRQSNFVGRSISMLGKYEYVFGTQAGNRNICQMSAFVKHSLDRSVVGPLANTRNVWQTHDAIQLCHQTWSAQACLAPACGRGAPKETAVKRNSLYNENRCTMKTAVQQKPLFNGSLCTMKTAVQRKSLYSESRCTTKAVVQ